MDNAEPIQLMLPPALLAEVQAVADEERRPLSEVVLELVERSLAGRRWRATKAADRALASELGMQDDDAAPMTDEYRQVVREQIEEGLASARRGELLDGDEVFSRLYAELGEQARE